LRPLAADLGRAVTVAHEAHDRSRRFLDRFWIRLDRFWIRLGRLDVAAPHPARVARALHGQHGRRLRIVDDDEVVAVLEPLGVPRRRGEVGVTVGLAQRLRIALEPVVHRLRDPEEGLVADDHLPLDVQPEVAEERHARAQQLGDAAAVRRGVQLQDPCTAQALGLAVERLQDVDRDDVEVRGKRTLPDLHGLETSGRTLGVGCRGHH
jgi:hypothetical protein